MVLTGVGKILLPRVDLAGQPAAGAAQGSGFQAGASAAPDAAAFGPIGIAVAFVSPGLLLLFLSRSPFVSAAASVT